MAKIALLAGSLLLLLSACSPQSEPVVEPTVASPTATLQVPPPPKPEGDSQAPALSPEALHAFKTPSH